LAVRRCWRQGYLRLRVPRWPADPDEDVRELITLVDEPTRSFLEKALALDDVRTDALAELRGVLLQEHEWRMGEGLV